MFYNMGRHAADQQTCSTIGGRDHNCLPVSSRRWPLSPCHLQPCWSQSHPTLFNLIQNHASLNDFFRNDSFRTPRCTYTCLFTPAGIDYYFEGADGGKSVHVPPVMMGEQCTTVPLSDACKDATCFHRVLFPLAPLSLALSLFLSCLSLSRSLARSLYLFVLKDCLRHMSG
jgi:hypothetical protein